MTRNELAGAYTAVVNLDARHRPVVWSGSRARRSSDFSSSVFPRRDVRNAGRFTAPAAPCLSKRGRYTWRPAPLNASRHRACRMLKEHTARAAGEGSPPQKQDDACVPHAMDFAACCMSQKAPLALALVPFERAVARTCTWAVRPFCRCLSRSEDQVRHRCGHRHPLRATTDNRGAPLKGAGWVEVISVNR